MGLEPTSPGSQPGASSSLTSATWRQSESNRPSQAHETRRETTPIPLRRGMPRNRTWRGVSPSMVSNHLAHPATRIPKRKAEESNPWTFVPRPGFQDRSPACPAVPSRVPSAPPGFLPTHLPAKGIAPTPVPPAGFEPATRKREPGLNRPRMPFRHGGIDRRGGSRTRSSGS